MAKKRISLSERKTRPLDELFGANNQVNNVTSKQSNNTTGKHVNNVTSKQVNKFIRKTYHLTEEIIDAIAIYSSFERKDKSEIIREAIKKYIPEKYFLMIKNKDSITNNTKDKKDKE